MAWTSGFFNSNNGDRVYNSDQLSSIFKGLITDGVYESVGNKMAVQPNSGMTVHINTGRGWFYDKWVDNDAPHLLTLAASDVTLNRYAAVGVKVDKNSSVRDVVPFVKYSEFATTPTKPEPERSELVREYVLAYVYIKAGASEIKASDIEDTRANTELCGWVTGLIKQIDTNTLFAQYDAAFKEWFESLQDYISEDVELTLMSDVALLKVDVEALETTTETHESRLDTLETSFQDGCNKLVADVTAKGVVPASNGVDDIIVAYTEAFGASSGGGEPKFIGGTAFSMNYDGFNNDNLDTTYLKKKTSSDPTTFIVQKDFEGIVELQILQYNTTSTPSVYCKVDGTTLLSVKCSNTGKLYRANTKATFTAGQTIVFSKGTGPNCAATASVFVLE